MPCEAWRMRVFSFLFMCAAVFGAAPALAQTPERLGTPFVEHFTTRDAERWYLADRFPPENMFSTQWRPSQAAFTPDGLVLTLAATPEPDAPKPYMSAEISSRETFRYGYFETRMRAVRGGGIVSGFFTFAMPTGPNTENEIDMEITGNAITQIELVHHANGRHIRKIVQLGFDASEGFHTYAFEWRTNQIRFFIDNRLVHTSRSHVRELDRPHQIFTSLWNSVRMPIWLGPFDASRAPYQMNVACMAYAERYAGRSLCAGGERAQN